MLVLSRKKDESIIIDGQIEIQVLKIKGNTIRLGIKAPSSVKILRGELSPFDIEARLAEDDATAGKASEGKEDDTKSPQPPASHSRFAGVEVMMQEITLPNPFAIADAG
jgi:carbon storage regulator CsrA